MSFKRLAAVKQFIVGKPVLSVNYYRKALTMLTPILVSKIVFKTL